MMNRRDLLKQLATTSAISAARALMPGVIFAAAPATDGNKKIEWKKRRAGSAARVVAY